MSEEKIGSQNEIESQLQLQEPNQQQLATRLSQPEMMEFVKLTRYASLASGRLAESLIKMTSRLEDEGYLRCDRPSRLNRDKKLRSHSLKHQKSDTEINNMMKLIPNHPDGEKLIQSLFKGIRNFNANIEETNNPLGENNQQQQQVNINNEAEDDQNQQDPGQLLTFKNFIDTSGESNQNNKFNSEELEKTKD